MPRGTQQFNHLGGWDLEAIPAVRLKAGIPTDVDFFTIPRDGFMVWDATHGILWVRTAGVWTPTSGASARVSHSAAQSIPNNVETPLLMNTVNDDQLGWFDLTSKFTPGYAGRYQMGGTAILTATAAGVWRVMIRLNGVTTLTASQVQGNASNYALASTAYTLTATDYVELTCIQNSGGAVNTTAALGDPNFWIVKV